MKGPRFVSVLQGNRTDSVCRQIYYKELAHTIIGANRFPRFAVSKLEARKS